MKLNRQNLLKSAALSMAVPYLSSCSSVEHVSPSMGPSPLSHGPILGGITSKSVKVWGRTAITGAFHVRYGTDQTNLNSRSVEVNTLIDHDNTASVELTNLTPDSKYHYAIFMGNEQVSPSGSFKTLPDSSLLKSEHNPDGLFNFSFEFACGNNQNPGNGVGPTVPFYDTLNEQFRDEVDFAIQNGDWIYEEKRDTPVSAWQKQTKASEIPDSVRLAPNLPGVWENYKTYIDRAPNLREWHRNIPSFFTFDDHELLNDIIGTGTTGYRSRRAAFRDIGIQGWYDYLGWSNPTAFNQEIHFGEAELKKGSDVLIDKSTDFTKINLKEASNLIVHWSTKDAGNMDSDKGDFKGGDPNSKVYEIVKVIDKHRVQIKPEAVATKRSKYAIGRYSFGSFKVGNCRFIMLDTKSHRDVHDIENPGKKGISMIGKKQRDWMKNLMKKKDADFYFVFSSVNFMVPHVGGGGATNSFAKSKDDAWTVFFDEREQLIDFWDKLGKKVFIMSGDLHNSYALKITNDVWEFASGPHNSVNHRPQDEGDRPVNGPFKYGPREVDIHWSTMAMGDIPRNARLFPHFCVVQVNNVFNNPIELGGQRLIKYPKPHVIFKFYDALTGEFKYAESVHAGK